MVKATGGAATICTDKLEGAVWIGNGRKSLFKLLPLSWTANIPGIGSPSFVIQYSRLAEFCQAFNLHGL